MLALPFNLGIGGAMQAGYLYAREHGYEVAVQVDGDGQHDPRFIKDLLGATGSPTRTLNMVTGSRFLDAEGDGYRSSAARRVGIRVFSRVVSLHHRPAGDRSDVRLSHDRPPRDRAVRPRLPARLPRDRGDPADARPPPQQLRDPGGDAGPHERLLAISSSQSIYYMVKVLLAVFVGLFRRQPVLDPPDAPVAEAAGRAEECPPVVAERPT